MSAIKKYLNQPYPLPEKKWRIIVFISFFVAFFLTVFQPFELSKFESHLKWIILLGYGVVTFLILVVLLILMPKLLTRFFDENKWTIGREFLLLTSVLFFIGCGNFIYSIQFFQFNLSEIKVFFVFQIFTTIVGIFPTSLVLILKQNRLLKQNILGASKVSDKLIEQTTSLNQPTEFIELSIDSNKRSHPINPQNILYIKSEGNYVSIASVEKGEISRKVFRSTMASVEADFMHLDYIFRCHRAFIVNLNYIEQVTGNAQGFRLKLKNLNESILVSRSYVAAFKDSYLLKIN